MTIYYAPKYFAGVAYYYKVCWRRLIAGDSYERIMGALGFINFLVAIPAWFGLIIYPVDPTQRSKT